MKRSPAQIEGFRRAEVESKKRFFSGDVRTAENQGYREVIKVTFADDEFTLDDARKSPAYKELLDMIRQAEMVPFIHYSFNQPWIAMRRPDFDEPARKYTSAQLRAMQRPSGVGAELVKSILILLCVGGAFVYGIVGFANLMYPETPQEQSR